MVLLLQIGCCVNFIGSEVSVAQCNVRNCTTIKVNISRAEALKCYRSRLHDDPTLNGCHDQLIASTISQVPQFMYLKMQLLI